MIGYIDPDVISLQGKTDVKNVSPYFPIASHM